MDVYSDRDLLANWVRTATSLTEIGHNGICCLSSSDLKFNSDK